MARTVERLRGQSHRSALVVGHGSSLRIFLEVLSGRPEPSLANLEYREVLHDAGRFTLAQAARAEVSER
jgi:hypothetical protein